MNKVDYFPSHGASGQYVLTCEMIWDPLFSYVREKISSYLIKI